MLESSKLATKLIIYQICNHFCNIIIISINNNNKKETRTVLESSW